MFILSQRRLKPVQHIGAIVIIALVYYGTAELSRYVASTPQSVTPVWPPDGFASAAVLIFGVQILPGVLIGSFLANIWAFFNADSWYMAIASVLQVLGIAIGTTIGAGVGNYLLRQTIKKRNPFKRLNDVYKFLFFTGTLAPMINATAGVICLSLGGKISWSMSGPIWLTWWVSNVAGICIFAPAILCWHEFYFKTITNKANLGVDHKNLSPPINLWRFAEAIVLIIISLWISFISFYQYYAFEYILIPCLVWAVIRFEKLLAINLIVVISMIAVLGTVRGLGAFSNPNFNYSLISLQSFIVVIVATTLSLIAILAEKQQAIAHLQYSEKKLTDKSIQLETSQSSLHETALMLESQNMALIGANKVAEAANRIKTEFLSNMSHELRTPLNAILGFTQLLQDSNNLENQDKSDLQAIEQAGNHLLNLIDDILDIAKIEAGKMEIELNDVFFPRFLQDLAEITQVLASKKNINFVYHFSDDLPEVVHADAQRLRQILLNLLSNAIKFTEKGHVILRVSCDKLLDLNSDVSRDLMSINFEVEDSGLGIDINRQEFIFLPFEQAGETRFKAQGSGLGLAISQKIATMMGSKITVVSQQDVGSIFRFTVDLGSPKNQFLSSSNKPEPNDKSAFDPDLSQKLPLKILLAEDNPVNQKVAHKILNRLGYEIDIASNGLKVLAALREHNYDVILMDVQMPEMDGLEATKYIVNDKDLKHRPYIIALTANAMDSDRSMCLDAGMNDFMRKPINVNLLVEALWRSRRGNQST